MEWKVVETSVLPKNPPVGPEDAIYESSTCIAALDGHSNRSPIRLAGRTGPWSTAGQFAVSTGLKAFAIVCNEPDLTPENMVQRLTRIVGQDLDLIFHDPQTRPGFVFAAFFPRFGRSGMIIRVGDCQYLIDGRGYNFGMAIEKRNAEVRQAIVQECLKKGRSIDDLRSADPSCTRMNELICAQTKYRNSNDDVFGFSVINGEGVPERLIEYIAVPEGAREIVLASDGYPVEALASSLAETEANLAAILAEDPLCIHRWPSVRGLKPDADRTDDCTYIRLVCT